MDVWKSYILFFTIISNIARGFNLVDDTNARCGNIAFQRSKPLVMFYINQYLLEMRLLIPNRITD